MPEFDSNLYVEVDPPVGLLGPRENNLLQRLPPRKQQYVNHLFKAAWAVAPLLHRQIPGARECFALISELYANGQSPLGEKEQIARFSEWAAAVCCNHGPYRGFGDTLLIPRLTEDQLKQIVETTASARNDPHLVNLLYNALPYMTGRACKQLGHWPECANCYYSQDMTAADVDAVDAVLTAAGTPLVHTDLRVDRAARVVYVCQNSVIGNETNPDLETRCYGTCTLSDGLEYSIIRKRGIGSKDVQRLLSAVQLALTSAHASTRRESLQNLQRYLLTASNLDWRTSQISWVRDRLPPVDYVIGRVESYRDPKGVRAEWEGCCFLVDRELSAQLSQLVAMRSQLAFPWGDHYRETTIDAPAYMAIECLAQVSSGNFIGLNLPNETDIRSEIGSKNFSMVNLLAYRSTSQERPQTFIAAGDQDVYEKWQEQSLSAQVVIHEGLGHAVGRLFTNENTDSWKGLPNCLNGEPLTDTAYTSSSLTYRALFGDLAQGMEEARAESAALFLSSNPLVLEQLGITTDTNSFVRVSFLSMFRSAVVGLEHYDPDSATWKQAHCFARWSIFAVCLRDAPDCVSLRTEDGPHWVTEGGVPRLVTGPHTVICISDDVAPACVAVERHLAHINHFRSVGDVEGARKYFSDLCDPSRHLDLRDEAIGCKQARMLYAPPIMEREGEGFVLREAPGETGVEKVIRGTLLNMQFN